MAIARLFLPLLILVGLALFALQNWSPVLPIVVAGLNTQALPLALWMLAAIAAGAATTVAVSSLFSLSRFTAVRRSNKQRPPVTASRPVTESRPWVAAWTKRNEARTNPSSSPRTRIQDDWENRQTPEEWDDWEEDSPSASRSSSSSTSASSEARDRSDEDWDNWEGYTEADRVSGNPRPPVRTDFEVKQAPVAPKQTGSIYSMSYEKADAPQRPNEVYDADYRVIVPPFSPEPAKAPQLEDEDWGFNDDDIPEEPRPSR